jgi:hypothetical protein
LDPLDLATKKLNYFANAGDRRAKLFCRTDDGLLRAFRLSQDSPECPIKVGVDFR